jgi:hypothetical protein
MMVVGPLGHTVVQASVVQQHTADDAKLGQQTNGAKHRGAPSAAAAVKKVIGSEVTLLLKDGRDDGAA